MNFTKVIDTGYILMMILLIGTCVAYANTRQDAVRNIGLTLTYLDMIAVFVAITCDVITDKARKKKGM